MGRPDGRFLGAMIAPTEAAIARTSFRPHEFPLHANACTSESRPEKRERNSTCSRPRRQPASTMVNESQSREALGKRL